MVVQLVFDTSIELSRKYCQSKFSKEPLDLSKEEVTEYLQRWEKNGKILNSVTFDNKSNSWKGVFFRKVSKSG